MGYWWICIKVLHIFSHLFKIYVASKRYIFNWKCQEYEVGLECVFRQLFRGIPEFLRAAWGKVWPGRRARSSERKSKSRPTWCQRTRLASRPIDYGHLFSPAQTPGSISACSAIWLEDSAGNTLGSGDNCGFGSMVGSWDVNGRRLNRVTDTTSECWNFIRKKTGDWMRSWTYAV